MTTLTILESTSGARDFSSNHKKCSCGFSHLTIFLKILVPAIAADQKGDNNDDINDSGMDTMYFQDSPEKEDFNRTAEVLGPRPGKGALDQLLCMKK